MFAKARFGLSGGQHERGASLTSKGYFQKRLGIAKERTEFIGIAFV